MAVNQAPHDGLIFVACGKAPSEYLKLIYYDTMLFRPEGVRHLAAEVGASQLMVGTDYPYPWTDTAVDLILETPGFSDADKRAILWDNAAGLLGLKSNLFRSRPRPLRSGPRRVRRSRCRQCRTPRRSGRGI